MCMRLYILTVYHLYTYVLLRVDLSALLELVSTAAFMRAHVVYVSLYVRMYVHAVLTLPNSLIFLFRFVVLAWIFTFYNSAFSLEFLYCTLILSPPLWWTDGCLGAVYCFLACWPMGQRTQPPTG
jgi:hypothetical protein